MSDVPPLRRPSDRIDELRDQLLRELNRLDKGGGEEPELYRAYLQHAQILVWRGVAEGRMDAPRQILEALRDAEPFVYLHRTGDPDPAATAAREVHFTLRSLQLAGEALERRQVEDRLADEERSQTEREILRVLLMNRGKYLRRGAIHDQLKPPYQPTPARVGQILTELDAEGLVLHIHGRAQGNPNAAFYALSPRGLEIARDLDLEKDDLQVLEEDDIRIQDVVNRVLDPTTSEKHRELLINMLANMSFGLKWLQILATLKREAGQKGPEIQILYKKVLRDLHRTRYMALTRGQPAEQPGAKSSGTLKFDSQSDEEKAARAEALSVEAEMAAV